MKIYPYLSDRGEINETDVKDVETCNLRKVWDNINLYSIYNSNNQRRFLSTRWNTITVRGKGKGKWGGKRTILSYFIFLDRNLS